MNTITTLFVPVESRVVSRSRSGDPLRGQGPGYIRVATSIPPVQRAIVVDSFCSQYQLRTHARDILEEQIHQPSNLLFTNLDQLPAVSLPLNSPKKMGLGWPAAFVKPEI